MFTNDSVIDLSDAKLTVYAILTLKDSALIIDEGGSYYVMPLDEKYDWALMEIIKFAKIKKFFVFAEEKYTLHALLLNRLFRFANVHILTNKIKPVISIHALEIGEGFVPIVDINYFRILDIEKGDINNFVLIAKEVDVISAYDLKNVNCFYPFGIFIGLKSYERYLNKLN